jgi:hypothetical protein
LETENPGEPSKHCELMFASAATTSVESFGMPTAVSTNGIGCEAFNELRVTVDGEMARAGTVKIADAETWIKHDGVVSNRATITCEDRASDGTFPLVGRTNTSDCWSSVIDGLSLSTSWRGTKTSFAPLNDAHDVIAGITDSRSEAVRFPVTAASLSNRTRISCEDPQLPADNVMEVFSTRTLVKGGESVTATATTQSLGGHADSVTPTAATSPSEIVALEDVVKAFVTVHVPSTNVKPAAHWQTELSNGWTTSLSPEQTQPVPSTNCCVGPQVAATTTGSVMAGNMLGEL